MIKGKAIARFGKGDILITPLEKMMQGELEDCLPPIPYEY